MIIIDLLWHIPTFPRWIWSLWTPRSFSNRKGRFLGEQPPRSCSRMQLFGTMIWAINSGRYSTPKINIRAIPVQKCLKINITIQLVLRFYLVATINFPMEHLDWPVSAQAGQPRKVDMTLPTKCSAWGAQKLCLFQDYLGVHPRDLICFDKFWPWNICFLGLCGGCLKMNMGIPFYCVETPTSAWPLQWPISFQFVVFDDILFPFWSPVCWQLWWFYLKQIKDKNVIVTTVYKLYKKPFVFGSMIEIVTFHPFPHIVWLLWVRSTFSPIYHTHWWCRYGLELNCR